MSSVIVSVKFKIICAVTLMWQQTQKSEDQCIEYSFLNSCKNVFIKWTFAMQKTEFLFVRVMKGNTKPDVICCKIVHINDTRIKSWQLASKFDMRQHFRGTLIREWNDGSPFAQQLTTRLHWTTLRATSWFDWVKNCVSIQGTVDVCRKSADN